MKRAQKIRVFFFFIILLIILYFSIRCCYGGYRLVLDFNTNVFDVQDFTMDGEDLTFMILPLRYGLYSILRLLNLVVYAMLILLVSLALFLPFCLIGLNKKRRVSKTEYPIYKYSIIGAFLFSVVLCVILTRFTSLITIALYNGIWVVCALLLVLVPAKKKMRN